MGASGFHVPDRVDLQTLASCPACRCLIRAFIGPRGRTVRWDYFELGDRKRVVQLLKDAGVPVGPGGLEPSPERRWADDRGRGWTVGLVTGIQWCHHTFNGWRGCVKISPGCAHCYAEKGSKRNPGVLGEWGPGSRRIIAAEPYWRQPLAWNRAAREAGERRRVFALSLGDWLEDRPDLDAPRARLLGTIQATPHLDWLLLSKRPENWRAALGRAWNVSPAVAGPSIGELVADWLGDQPPANVWLGVSVEDQTRADERIPILLKIPARVRFLSCEPLLSDLDLGPWLFPERGPHSIREAEIHGDSVPVESGISWVIVGGESKQGRDPARPFDLGWARSIRDQCRAAGVACFVKQLGSSPVGLDRPLADGHGGDWDEWPEDLRVREIPAVLAEGSAHGRSL